MNPVDYVIFVLGGPAAVARELGITHSAICQWKISGQIPAKRMPEILSVARIRGLDITPKDLIEGRKLDDKA